LLPEFNTLHITRHRSLVFSSALFIQAMRHARVWAGIAGPIGLLAMRAVPILCAISLMIGAGQIANGHYFIQDWPHSWYSVHIGNVERAQLSDQLARTPGQHLVIVRYGPRHSVHDEWVYNSSDIDGLRSFGHEIWTLSTTRN